MWDATTASLSGTPWSHTHAHTPVWWGTWSAAQAVCLSHWRGSSPACHRAASPSPQTLSPGSRTCTPGSRCPGDVNSEAQSPRSEKVIRAKFQGGERKKKGEEKMSTHSESVNCRSTVGETRTQSGGWMTEKKTKKQPQEIWLSKKKKNATFIRLRRFWFHRDVFHWIAVKRTVSNLASIEEVRH